MKKYVMICNIAKFDIIKQFAEVDSIVWKNNRNCKLDDIIYLYVGRPYSRLMYKCVVVEENSECPKEMEYYATVSKTSQIEYMRLKLIDALPNEGFGLSDLIANGLKTVQCSTEVSENLSNYIDRMCLTMKK